MKVLGIFVALAVWAGIVFFAMIYYTDWNLAAYVNNCRLQQNVNVWDDFDHYCIDPKNKAIISRYEVVATP